jgi:pilus assembly protein CpaF
VTQRQTAVGQAGRVTSFVPRDPRRGIPVPRDPAADAAADDSALAARPLAPSLVAVLGPLAAAVANPRATDVFVTGDGSVWSDEGAGSERLPGVRLAAAAARELAVRLIAEGGRHVDEATPSADVRLGQGIRAHVVLPPLAWEGTAISLRLPRVRRVTLETAGLPTAVLETLRSALRERRTLLITGGTGSGKTTLMAAWLSDASPRDRIVLIEDVAEAPVQHPHLVALECRQANLEGAGEVDVARLVREALRMRPDRLVVGECRGAEVREFLAALNTGHRGGAGTLHANSLADVPSRLEAIGMIAGLTPEALARQVCSGIDLAVHVQRTDAGERTAELGRFALDGGERLTIIPLADAP